MKLSAMFVLLALLMAPLFAYDVGIKVTVSQDTLAVGTNITIVKDGTLLYNTRADGNGAASFKLDSGSYFVYLDRGSYSRHVNLLEISKNENITYTMRQLISSANAYGQITGPTDFAATSVGAYANGKIVKRVSPNSDGYYTVPYILEGEYELVFSAPGFVEKNVSATLLQSQFSEVNVKLDKISVAPMAQPTITVPPVVQKQSVIEILVARGALPLSEQVVSVKTPSGNLEVITDVDGKAHVNAVLPGEYIFTCGNLTSKTIVEGKANVTVLPPVVAEPVVLPATTQPQAPPANAGLVAGAAAVVMGGIIVALGVIFFVMSKVAKKHKPEAEAETHKHERAAHHKASETPESAHEHETAPHAHKHETGHHAPAHKHKK